MSRSRLFLAVLVAVTVGCGGGGDGGTEYEESVAITEWVLSDSDRYSLGGDWPMDRDLTGSFIVRSQSEWDALWAARKAAVTCNPISQPYNEPFCATATPPPIDFSRYAMVGLLISSVRHFDTPTPRTVTTDSSRAHLSVTYRYFSPSTPTFFYTVSGRFFLIPRTGAALEVHARSCGLNC